MTDSLNKSQSIAEKLNSLIGQLLLLLAVMTGPSMFVIFLVNVDQFAFAQENTDVQLFTNTSFPRIHNYTSFPPGPVNSWFIESTNGVVIIDTQRTLSDAENALDEIKGINKPILGVIITHPHPDHIGGTEVLLNGTSNVPIYSTQAIFDIMKNDTGGLIALTKQLHGDDYPDQVVLPNKILQSGDIITIDGITYSFEDIGPGEAGDMMLIYLPEQKFLFTGDVVNNRMHPALIEGHSSEWIKQLEYIGQNYSDARILFPGHGQSGSPKALLDEQLEYINTFRSLVDQQMQVTGNITEEGKTTIKSELEKLYPDYLHVASLPLSDMLDLNIDAITGEIVSTPVEPTRNEEGNLGYVLYRSNDNPDELIFDELWINQGALDFHLEQPYLLTALEQISPILNSSVQVRTYTEVLR
jgi:glyoxylase-like metal-dependent hydrolase (beta-lactamase superfamily II)/quinol monooxygenase YgiN